MTSGLIVVRQGDHAVSADPAVTMTAVLGSCVAACLHDPMVHAGGMNHFLLPDGPSAAMNASYGIHAMELLINSLMRAGAARNRLRAHLYGGAAMLDHLSNDIGEANAAFACGFLQDEGISIVHADVGGRAARRVEFLPALGRVRSVRLEADRPALRSQHPPIPAIEIF